MDGRVHPVAWLYVMVKLRLRLVDAPNLAGPAHFFAYKGRGEVGDAVRWRAKTSVEKNGAEYHGTVCHSQCSGHDVCCEDQRIQDLHVAMRNMRDQEHVPQDRVFGLYITCNGPWDFGRVKQLFWFRQDGSIYSVKA